MKSILKVAVAAAVLTLGSALPAMAQIDGSIDFTSSNPFYAGNAKMPAGSYRITQSDENADWLFIRSADGKYSAFVGFIPTLSEQPHQKSAVSFAKYGDVEYMDHIWVEGESYGFKVDPTKEEQKAASDAAVVEHSAVGN